MLLDYIMGRTMSKILRYSEMLSLDTFDERFEYLKLNGFVGDSTFGFDRYVNQNFYSSREWRSVRSEIIIRDDGCDLADPSRPIFDRVYIHHLNPITLEQFENMDSDLLDPENLVCVSYNTHAAIHYGTDDFLKVNTFADRKPGDTLLW